MKAINWCLGSKEIPFGQSATPFFVRTVEIGNPWCFLFRVAAKRNGARRRPREREKEGRRKKKFRNPKTYLRRPSFPLFSPCAMHHSAKRGSVERNLQRSPLQPRARCTIPPATAGAAESPTIPLPLHSPRTIPPATAGAGGISNESPSTTFAVHHSACDGRSGGISNEYQLSYVS